MCGEALEAPQNLGRFFPTSFLAGHCGEDAGWTQSGRSNCSHSEMMCEARHLPKACGPEPAGPALVYAVGFPHEVAPA